MGLKELFNEILNNKKEYEIKLQGIQNNVINTPYDEYKKLYIDSTNNNSRLHNIINSFKNHNTSLGIYSKIIDSYADLMGNYANECKELLVNVAKNYYITATDSNNLTLFEDQNFKSKSYEDRISTIGNLIPDQKVKLENSLYTYLVERLSSYINKNPERLLNVIEQNANIETQNAIIENNNNFTPNLTNLLDSVVVEKNKIDNLINTSNGIEKDNLQFAKDNILTVSSENNASNLNDVAEHAIQNFNRFRSNTTHNTFDESPTLKGKVSLMAGGRWQVNDNFFKTDINEINATIQNNPISISEKNKALVKECLHIIDNMTNYKTGKPLLDMNLYLNEEAIKVYAFANFNNLYKDMSEAVASQDKEQILNLTNISKPLFSEMDNLIEKANQIETTSLPGNVSLARTRSIPLKYTSQIEAASKVNGLWHTLALIKKHNLDIDKFVDNPTKCYMEAFEKHKNYAFIDNLTNNDDIAFVKFISNSNNFAKFNVNFEKTFNGMRPFEFLSTLDPAKNKENLISQTYLDALKITPLTKAHYDAYYQIASNDIDVLTQNIKNIMVSPKEDNKQYHKYCSVPIRNTDGISKEQFEPFNYDEYIANANIDYKYVANKLNNLKNSVNTFIEHRDDIAELPAEIAGDLLYTKDISKNAGFQDLCDLYEITPVGMYQHYAEKSHITDYVSSKFNEVDIVNNKTSENLTLCCNSLKALNDKWSSRTIFGKILKPTAWLEKKAINNMKQTMQEVLPEGCNIDEMLSGQTKVDEFVNNINTQLHSQEQNIEKVERVFSGNTMENEVSIEKKSEFIKVQEKDKQLDNIDIKISND